MKKMDDVNTRDGVFSDKGFGGGVFNLNTAFGSYEGDDMQQHNYDDVSNLNAPYISRAVQGISGGLGYYGPDHPWGTMSEATKTLQAELNTHLNKNGYQLLAVDGKMGPKTCGAAKFFGYTFTGGDPCAGQTVTLPAMVGSTAPPVQQVVIGPATLDPGSTQAPAMTASLGGGMGKWPLILGAVAGIGVVVYMMHSKGKHTTKLTWW